MKFPVQPEPFALNSMMLGCHSADSSLAEFQSTITGPKRLAFLEEFIFFHHYMAFEAAFHVFHDLDARRDYCDRVVMAVQKTRSLQSFEEYELPPTNNFYSPADIKQALKNCFGDTGNLNAVFRRTLYLERRSFEPEFKIMNHKIVRHKTGWDGAEFSGRTELEL